MFAFLFVLEIGPFLSFSRSVLFFLFVSPLAGGEVAEAGPAFVEFSDGITALSLCLCRPHTHAAHVQSPGSPRETHGGFNLSAAAHRRYLHLDC